MERGETADPRAPDSAETTRDNQLGNRVRTPRDARSMRMRAVRSSARRRERNRCKPRPPPAWRQRRHAFVPKRGRRCVPNIEALNTNCNARGLRKPSSPLSPASPFVWKARANLGAYLCFLDELDTLRAEMQERAGPRHAPTSRAGPVCLLRGLSLEMRVPWCRVLLFIFLS